MNKKDSNPKDEIGVKKVPLHNIPCKPLFELGLAMMEGSRKYGSHNYRAIGARASVYYDAAMRHLTAWWEGEDIDPDSGVHHLIKVAACMFVIRDSMHMGNYTDDRPLKYIGGIFLNEFNKKAEQIIDKYPECTKPYLNKKIVDKPKVIPHKIEIVHQSSDYYILINYSHYLWKDGTVRYGSTGWFEAGKPVNRCDAPGWYATREEAEKTVEKYFGEIK